MRHTSGNLVLRRATMPRDHALGGLRASTRDDPRPANEERAWVMAKVRVSGPQKSNAPGLGFGLEARKEVVRRQPAFRNQGTWHSDGGGNTAGRSGQWVARSVSAHGQGARTQRRRRRSRRAPHRNPEKGLLGLEKGAVAVAAGCTAGPSAQRAQRGRAVAGEGEDPRGGRSGGRPRWRGSGGHSGGPHRSTPGL